MADMPGADSDLTLTDRDLGLLQFSTVLYYLHETNPDNGLVRDKTDPNAPVSIAAVGMALATIPVVVERGVLYRDFAAKITRKRLRYLIDCPQGPEPDAAGYKGFFYHFLDIDTGRRVPDSPTCWWVTPWHFGIDQGPVVLMVENYRSGLLWNIMRRCPAIVTGLRRAGFTGGWL